MRTLIPLTLGLIVGYYMPHKPHPHHLQAAIDNNAILTFCVSPDNSTDKVCATERIQGLEKDSSGNWSYDLP